LEKNILLKESHVFDPEKIELLESEDRKTWQNTQEIFELINLKPYYSVTDLGCGSGYFSIPLSGIVKKVYSIDFQKEMLDYLKQKIEKKKINNIELILSKANKIPLINNCADLLLTVNTLHEFENRNDVILEIHRLINHN
jgi:ubiquinone/menaquinone biosynthesis C-methylase UbiE